MTTEIRVPLHGRYTRPDGATITVTPTGIEFYKVRLEPAPVKGVVASMTASEVREMIAAQKLTKEEAK